MIEVTRSGDVLLMAGYEVEHQKGSLSWNAPSDLDYYGYADVHVYDVAVLNERTGEWNQPGDVYYLLFDLPCSSVQYPGKTGRYGTMDEMLAWFEVQGNDQGDEFICTGMNIDKALSALDQYVQDTVGGRK